MCWGEYYIRAWISPQSRGIFECAAKISLRSHCLLYIIFVITHTKTHAHCTIKMHASVCNVCKRYSYRTIKQRIWMAFAYHLTSLTANRGMLSLSLSLRIPIFDRKTNRISECISIIFDSVNPTKETHAI